MASHLAWTCCAGARPPLPPPGLLASTGQNEEEQTTTQTGLLPKPVDGREYSTEVSSYISMDGGSWMAVVWWCWVAAADDDDGIDALLVVRCL